MRQHYVPRVYLKFFAEKDKDEFIVDVYEKKKDRHFRTNITNVCVETDLYTLSKNQTVANDTLAIEKIYADILEPIYRKVYDLLIDTRITKITHQQHNEILIGIFQLYTRNPKLLNNLIEFSTSEINELYKQAKKDKIKGLNYLNEDFSFQEYSEEDIIKISIEKITKDYKERHIIGTKEICEFHLNAKYEVTEIIDDAQFFTSDNPLVFEDMVTKNEHPLLKSKEFIIPLNKKFALKIFHDNTKKLNFIYRQKIPNGTASILNDNIFNNCSRFIIGEKKGFDEYFKMAIHLNDTSLNKKMYAVRQILLKGEMNDENREISRVMRTYLDKYDKEGGLTKIDEEIFYRQIKKMNADWKKNRIK